MYNYIIWNKTKTNKNKGKKMKEAIEMLQQLQEQFFDGGVNGPNKDNWSLKRKLFKDAFASAFENEDSSVSETLNQILELASKEGVLHRFVIGMFYHFEKEFAAAWAKYRMTQLSQATGERSQQVFENWVAENSQWKVQHCIHIFNNLFEYIQDDCQIVLYDIDEPKTLNEIGEMSISLMQRIKELGKNHGTLSYEAFLTENLFEIFEAEWFAFMENANYNGELVDFCWMAENGGDFFRTNNLSDALLTLLTLRQQTRYYEMNDFWEWCFDRFNDNLWSEVNQDTENLKMFAAHFGLYFKCIEDVSNEDDDDDDHLPRWR